MPNPRERIKSLCETILVRGRVVDVARALRPHTGVILAYHNVVEDGWIGPGERSLHLSRSRFREQLDYLVERCEVVTLDDLAAAEGPGERPRVAITFDDA